MKYTAFLLSMSSFFTLGSCTNAPDSPTTPQNNGRYVTPIFQIDNTTYQSISKSQRIQHIIVHYTAEDHAQSVSALTQGEVSSHYLIDNDDTDIVYQLVPDHERAWHAGDSFWAGRKALNDTSIGIEIVNDGIARDKRNSSGLPPYHHFVDYEERQIQKVAFLLKTLADKYQVLPQNILAHSDIAPTRKTDPGAKFPWERLYQDYGIGAWYEPQDKALFNNQVLFESTPIANIKQAFRDYGYAMNDTEEWDNQSLSVVYAFQLHFNPRNATGNMDVETFAILMALVKKYRPPTEP